MDGKILKLDGDPGGNPLKTSVVEAPPPTPDGTGEGEMEVDGGSMTLNHRQESHFTSPRGIRGGEDELVMLRGRVARLEGELAVTSKALKSAEHRLNERNTEVVDATSEMKFTKKMRDTAELQLARSEDEYKDLCKRHIEVKEDLEWHKRRYAEANDRVADLELQLDRLDGGRPRKRSAMNSPATVPSTVDEATKSAILTEKVSIADAVRSAAGLFKEMISPSRLPVPVPSPLPWMTGVRGVPYNINDWNLAFEFIMHNEQWSIAHVLFGAYLGARNIDAANRNDYERHIVDTFILPNWFWNGLRSYAGNKKMVTESHNLWNSLKRPVYGDPMTASAAWFMHFETPPPGLRWRDSYGSLSLRELRGSLLWEQIGYDRKKHESADRGSRKKYEAVARALLTVLSVPEAYERDLAADKIVVAATLSLAHWPPEQTEGITDNMVVRRLASMGFTVAMANDIVPFCYGVLLDLRDHSQAGWPTDEVELMIAACEEKPMPPGKFSKYPDIFPRPAFLPYKLRDDNRVQDSGVFSPNLPREEGPVIIPEREERAIGVHGIPTRTNTTRGRGGGRGRGARPTSYSTHYIPPPPPPAHSNNNAMSNHPHHVTASTYAQLANTSMHGNHNYAYMQPAPGQPHIIYTNAVAPPPAMMQPHPSMTQPTMFTTIPPPSSTIWTNPNYHGMQAQGLNASMHAPFANTFAGNPQLRPASINAPEMTGAPTQYFITDTTMTNATPEAAFDVGDLAGALHAHDFGFPPLQN
ncbi:hypothetical protein C8R44DRAFT_883188 [Mycena epipterygia]|nr:hypothetical protein C8R44DRAFT_883188 [Mycena epipterygia]